MQYNTITTTTGTEFIPNWSTTQFIYDDAYRKAYEEDLRRRQQEHLNNLMFKQRWQACAHDSCSNCLGTGIGRFGGICVHGLVCNCPRCSPTW